MLRAQYGVLFHMEIRWLLNYLRTPHDRARILTVVEGNVFATLSNIPLFTGS